MFDLFVIGAGLPGLVAAATVLTGGTERRRERRRRAPKWSPWLPERYDGIAVIVTAGFLVAMGVYLLASALR
mgnify:CR=1 FL=1